MLRIRHWVLKAAAQKAFSILPGGQIGNSLLQRYCTRSLDLNYDIFEEGLGLCRKHLENYFAIRGNAEPGFSVFELGTGWYPLIPIGISLCGASKVWTLDVRSLLSPKRVRLALALYCRCAEQGALARLLPWADAARIRTLLNVGQRVGVSSVDDMLRPMQICPIVGDAREVGLASGSIDFFFSQVVLNEIPEDVLSSIFTEFRRLAAPRAIMSHHFFMGDQYVFFDPSITAFNFLRFSRRHWKLIDNSLHSQNRLRLSDYRRIHQSTGWSIIIEDVACGSLEDLRKVRLAGEFQGCSEQDLLAVWARLTSCCGSVLIN